MAMNKYMHPRNIYKVPPDFKKLAQMFPEFAGVSEMALSGKVSIDFKNPHALRVLTRCLLLSDFKLDILIPEDRLVPTLPLRLNYILWLEDLLNAINNNTEVIGLDIGTGACAIYPMLAATKNKWSMVGTETDDESFKFAKDNVEKNYLQNLIELRKNPTDTTMEYLFMDDKYEKFHFCMCNPPFYTNFQELWESRSPARPPPKNGFTGSPQELITEGGELSFCRKMIEESKKLKDKIVIFTTMVGHKYNLKELLLDLKADGIKYTTTEFCQGRVTRWGLAWTYQNNDLYKLVPFSEKTRKKTPPVTFVVPDLADTPYTIDVIFEKIKNILNNLNTTIKILSKRKNEICLEVIAFKNTWSNQRRKRRLLKQQIEMPESKKVKTEKTSQSEKHENTEISLELKSHQIEDSEDTTSTKNPLCHTVLKLVHKDKKYLIEMEFISGTGGKEGLHQILQYIKNIWK